MAARCNERCHRAAPNKKFPLFSILWEIPRKPTPGLARSSLNRRRRMSRWPTSQGSTSPAGAPPPNLVRRGSACRHGQTKAKGRAPGCFARVRIPGRPIVRKLSQVEQPAKAGRWRVRIPLERCPQGRSRMKAVPAGAGRKARRASDRLRFRAIGRAAARPARRRTTTRCRMRRRALRRRASAPPARLRRTAIRTMRVIRRPLKKRTRICGCDMS